MSFAAANLLKLSSCPCEEDAFLEIRPFERFVLTQKP
jgi:hypothetical protein